MVYTCNYWGSISSDYIVWACTFATRKPLACMQYSIQIHLYLYFDTLYYKICALLPPLFRVYLFAYILSFCIFTSDNVVNILSPLFWQWLTVTLYNYNSSLLQVTCIRLTCYITPLQFSETVSNHNKVIMKFGFVIDATSWKDKTERTARYKTAVRDPHCIQCR